MRGNQVVAHLLGPVEDVEPLVPRGAVVVRGTEDRGGRRLRWASYRFRLARVVPRHRRDGVNLVTGRRNSDRGVLVGTVDVAIGIDDVDGGTVRVALGVADQRRGREGHLARLGFE
jgi:hypothetical protein